MSRLQKSIWIALIGTAVALRIAFFTISVTRVQPSSDESAVMLQARQITQGKLPLLFLSQPYLFPVEAYLVAPFSGLLPCSALGARLLPALAGFLSLLIATCVMRRVSPSGIKPINLLLILFPSSYLLMLQAAYALPGYVSAQVLGGMSIWGALYNRQDSHHPILTALLTGFIAGLSFSSHPLMLPFVLVGTLYVCLDHNLPVSLKHSAGFLPGLLLGLIPYILAKIHFPDSYSDVTAMRGITDALKHLWTPTFNPTLTTALGIRTCLFPDQRAIGPSASILMACATFLAAMLLGMLVWRAWMFVRRVFREKRVYLEDQDLFIGITTLSILAFALNKRADAESYRYLLPVLLCFPFLINSLYIQTGGGTRKAVAGFIVCITLWNLGSSVRLMGYWNHRDFAGKEAALPDLNPALNYLETNGIRYCVASYGAAYRINFQSGYRIVCAQPVNERFPNWPLAYKDQVDAATNVAYVLTDSIRFLKPAIFERHLRTMHIECRTAKAGDFTIYHEFRKTVPSPPVHPGPFTLSASHQPENAKHLTDGILKQPWSSCAIQESGMWVEVTFPAPAVITGMQIFYDRWGNATPRELDFFKSTGNGWEHLASIKTELDKFGFPGDHPVYGKEPQTVTWPATSVSAIRMVITRPRPMNHWVIGELQLLSP